MELVLQLLFKGWACFRPIFLRVRSGGFVVYVDAFGFQVIEVIEIMAEVHGNRIHADIL